MSSTRNTLPPYLAINAGNLGANITSPVTNVKFHRVVSIQLTAAAGSTAVGSWVVQVSNDITQDPVLNPPVNWIPLTIVPPLNFTGSAQTIGTGFDKFAWAWIRLVYTRTSGTGTVNAVISAQGA